MLETVPQECSLAFLASAAKRLHIGGRFEGGQLRFVIEDLLSGAVGTGSVFSGLILEQRA